MSRCGACSGASNRQPSTARSAVGDEGIDESPGSRFLRTNEGFIGFLSDHTGPKPQKANPLAPLEPLAPFARLDPRIFGKREFFSAEKGAGVGHLNGKFPSEEYGVLRSESDVLVYYFRRDGVAFCAMPVQHLKQ